MTKFTFIIVLIIILCVAYIYKCKENFELQQSQLSQSSQQQSSQGVFNYFYQSYMNPYPLPLNNFFSNDRQNN